ncbi:MAG: ParA family protein [Clostridia bacterium]
MINIICGHYGSGKTNLCLNLAIEQAKNGKKVTLVDMDVVNPYFRTSDYTSLTEKYGIEIIAPEFAGTTLDTPTIPAKVRSAFIGGDKTVFIDLGGDDVGATAIAQFAKEIPEYNMIYVINKSRVMSQKASEAIEILHEIEIASHLTATGIVNNTHLGVETTKDIIENSINFAQEVAHLANLPLLYTTAVDFAYVENCKKIERLVIFPWE